MMDCGGSAVRRFILDEPGENEVTALKEGKLDVVDENSVDFKTTRGMYMKAQARAGDSVATSQVVKHMENCSPRSNAIAQTRTETNPSAQQNSILELVSINSNPTSNPNWLHGSIPPKDIRTGEMICVDARFEVHNISNLDIVNGTVFVKISSSCYWTDSRLAGWTLNSDLPPDLWGPVFTIKNSREMTRKQEYFGLLEKTTGRLKRVHIFEGTIEFCNSNLEQFPYDVHNIPINFHNRCWSSNSGVAEGYNDVYQVRKMQRVNEGTWIKLSGKTNRILNFQVLGISSFVQERVTEMARLQTNLTLSIHIARKFAWWKVLMPMYLLALSSFQIYMFHPHEQVETWASIITLHLVALIIYFCCYLFLSPELPKSTTLLDKSILCTALALFVNGIVSAAMYLRAEYFDAIDNIMSDYVWSAITILFIYLCSQMAILIPTHLRFLRRFQTLSRNFPSISVGPEATRVPVGSADSMAWPVGEGHVYRTFEYLTRGEKRKQQKKNVMKQRKKVGNVNIPNVVMISSDNQISNR